MSGIERRRAIPQRCLSILYWSCITQQCFLDLSMLEKQWQLLFKKFELLDKDDETKLTNVLGKISADRPDA